MRSLNSFTPALRHPCLARYSAILGLLLGLLLSQATAPAPVAAQQPLTAADSAAVLLDAARHFDATGREEVAGALYRLIAERYPQTVAGVAAVTRLQGTARFGAERSGRVELQVWGALYGLWLGIAVPTAFGWDEPEAYGAGILLGAPAGLLAARAVTRSRDLTEGQTRAITWGGTWGTWQGLGWAHVFDWGSRTVCDGQFCYEEGETTEAQFKAMIAGGLLGATAGSLLSRRTIPAGVAAGAHYGSLWGTWLGVAGGLLGDLDDDDLMTATLLAGNAGLLAGAWVADRHALSRNRVRLVSLAGLLGGLAGLGLDLLIQPDDSDVAIGIPLVLSGAGLATGAYLTRDYDRTVRIGSRNAPGGGGSLFGFDATGASWDLPILTPTLVRSLDANGRERNVPGVGVMLLRGRF